MQVGDEIYVRLNDEQSLKDFSEPYTVTEIADDMVHAEKVDKYDYVRHTVTLNGNDERIVRCDVHKRFEAEEKAETEKKAAAYNAKNAIMWGFLVVAWGLLLTWLIIMQSIDVSHAVDMYHKNVTIDSLESKLKLSNSYENLDSASYHIDQVKRLIDK